MSSEVDVHVQQSENEPFALPQPAKKKSFRYVRVEEINSAFFQTGSPSGSQHDRAPDAATSLFEPGQLVWVCKSKGLRKGKKRKNAQDNKNSSNNGHEADDNNKNNKNTRTPPARTRTNDNVHDAKPAHCLELFLRARVLKPEGDRIRVQYPKGSTYACQKCNLIPVLENNQALVLVAAETSDYRRCSVVHTLPHESFMEIGCDYGITPDRIRSRGVEGVSRKIWGVDKSTESISIAKRRYPNVPYFECDVLETPKATWPQELQDAEPNVIAVDINGNRELEAVCQCLEVMFRSYQPRLIIVKSRALHAKVQHG